MSFEELARRLTPSCYPYPRGGNDAKSDNDLARHGPDGQLSGCRHTTSKGVAVHRILRMLPIGSMVLVSAFAFAGLATAADPPSGNPQPAGAAGTAGQPVKPQPVNSTACTPANNNGYQLCSSDKGALQLVATASGESFYRLSLTGLRELRHNGAVVYRSDEQHLEYDLTNKAGAPQTQEFVRTGAVIVTGSETCTYDDRAVFADRQLRRDVSNLTCGPSE
jgi:hypothetical protein